MQYLLTATVTFCKVSSAIEPNNFYEEQEKKLLKLFIFQHFDFTLTTKRDENLRKVRVTGISSPTFVRSPIDMIRNKIYVFHFIVAAYSPATILLNKYSKMK